MLNSITKVNRNQTSFGCTRKSCKQGQEAIKILTNAGGKIKNVRNHIDNTVPMDKKAINEESLKVGINRYLRRNFKDDVETHNNITMPKFIEKIKKDPEAYVKINDLHA